MIGTLISWMLIIVLEIIRNYHIIDIKKRRPVYWQSNVLRIAVGFGFWVVAPIVAKIPYWSWWGMIPMMLFTFWFVFDYGLNLARKKRPFFYLNPKGSWLDRFQYNSTGTFSWFFWKLILMAGGLWLFFKGLDVAWRVQW